jgi:hypothetical protein
MRSTWRLPHSSAMSLSGTRGHIPRWPLLGAVACSMVLAAGSRPLAAGANVEECGKFHVACTQARAQGPRDASICNVERLACGATPGNEPGGGRRARGEAHPRWPRPDHPARSVGP